MSTGKTWKGAADVAQQLRSKSPNAIACNWQLRWMPVCSSTEIALSEWLRTKKILDNQARAVFAASQRYSFGQQGKVWHAPKGGVWISAAVQSFGSQQSAGLFGLAVALAMSERLETNGVKTQIKWPNDLLVGERKLVGVLPRLIHRGSSVKLARVGVGMNVWNRVPKEGISLLEILPSLRCNINFWSAEVLLAIEKAVSFSSKPEWICSQVEKRLWLKELRDPINQEIWEIDSINLDGTLRLKRGSLKKNLTRW